MSIPNYVYALANHKGPATVTAGGMIIPVKIMDIEHESKYGMTDECTFKCMVVNQDQIRYHSAVEKVAKQAINSVYGANHDNYVARALSESLARLKESAASLANGPSAPKPEGVLRRSGRYPWGMEIDRVIFNKPATIVIWADGTKTVVKCQEGDVYSKETGLALCIAKKALGNQGNFNDIFHKWIPEEDEAQEAESSEPGCSYCSCATRTDKRFIVHTPSGLEIETVFNHCPCCGRKIPEVPNEMPEM